MSKVAVVFWSATGNTETMANCVAEGANGTIVPCGEMNAAQVLNGEGLICNEAPDEDVQAACRKLGADLAAW